MNQPINRVIKTMPTTGVETMTDKLSPWKITQIESEIRESYLSCYNDFERNLWRAYAAKDCKRILEGRKPTPVEQAILDRYGIHIGN